MVADDAVFEGQPQFLGIADRRRHAGVRDWHDNVGIGRRFARQLPAHLFAHLVDRAAADDGVGTGEIDVFEDAESGRIFRHEAVAFQPLTGDHHDLAVLHLTHEFGADDVQRARLRGEHPGLAELAEDERPDSERIARADQLLVGEPDQGIGAFDLEQGFDQLLDEALLLAAGDEMQDHLGVGGRLADGAFFDQGVAQRQRVGEIAVMAQREAARIEIDEQRLHVAQHWIAASRIADVAYRHVAFQPLDHRARSEMVADQADAAFGMEVVPVEADDAGRFLAAMLERMQAERSERRGIGMIEDAEDAALLVQPVLFEPVQVGPLGVNVLSHGLQPPPSR